MFSLSFLLLAFYLLCAPLCAQSGHHYSFLEGAAIGHDFGRNPWSSNDTVGFVSARGRSNLNQALVRAVSAGETVMSFDFAFDLRSIVKIDADGSIQLDRYVLSSIDAFLGQVEQAHETARRRGNSFAADVVLFDFRLADGERVDERVDGEHPVFFTSETARQKLFSALAPALERLGRHPRITLNLINEPEFLAVPAAKAIAKIESGEWAGVPFVGPDRQAGGKIAVVKGEAAAALIRGLGEGAHVRVDAVHGAARKIVETQMQERHVHAFLLDLRAAIRKAAPLAQVTIGWADDRSALENTRRLEEAAGAVVTEVISFHVYQVPSNPWHPLRLGRVDFAALGWGSRSIRVTEWGLGKPEGDGAIREAMAAAFAQVEAAGLEGVLFWWDRDHVFDHGAYAAVVPAHFVATAVESAAVEVSSAAIARETFPNPFNGRVVIPYSVREQGEVVLRIYNTAGQKIRTLVRAEWKETGRYRAEWNGLDDEGGQAASGVYMWELRTAVGTERKKMTLLR